MAREAFLPLFVGDFLSSTVTWDGEEKALYLLLLAYQWAAGPLPADPARLAKTAGYDLKRFAKLWEVVGTKFELTDGGLSNPRLEVHRAKSHEVSRRRAEAGAKGGQATRQTSSKTEAIATARLEHPSHPIPSHIPPPPAGAPPLAGGAPDGAPPVRVNGFHGERPETQPAQPKAKREKRGPLAHRVPPDFEVPDAQAEWAKREFPAVDLYRETQKFRDHEFAVARSDWLAAWRNWMRRASENPTAGASNGRR